MRAFVQVVRSPHCHCGSVIGLVWGCFWTGNVVVVFNCVRALVKRIPGLIFAAGLGRLSNSSILISLGKKITINSSVIAALRNRLTLVASAPSLLPCCSTTCLVLLLLFEFCLSLLSSSFLFSLPFLVRIILFNAVLWQQIEVIVKLC